MVNMDVVWFLYYIPLVQAPTLVQKLQKFTDAIMITLSQFSIISKYLKLW